MSDEEIKITLEVVNGQNAGNDLQAFQGNLNKTKTSFDSLIQSTEKFAVASYNASQKLAQTDLSLKNTYNATLAAITKNNDALGTALTRYRETEEGISKNYNRLQKLVSIYGIFNDSAKSVANVMEKIGTSFSNASKKAEPYIEKLEKIHNRINLVTNLLNGNKEVDKFTDSIEHSTKENKKFSEGLLDVAKNLSQVGAKISSMTLGDISSPITNFLERKKEFVIGAGLISAGATATSTVIANNLLKSFIEVDEELRNVNSLLLETPQGFSKLSENVRDLSLSMKLVTETQISQGLYSVSGAGFAGADGIIVMDTAIKTSRAGRADLIETSKVLAQTLNGMGLSAQFAEYTANVLFKTVERGVLEFKDVAQGAGKVTATLKSLNQPLEVMGASLAIMTRKGTIPEMAFTNLNSLLLAFAAQSQESKEKAFDLGISIDANAVKTKGFAKVLNEMVSAAKSTGDLEGTLFKLLGRQEAMNAALQLSNAEEFKAELKAFSNSFTALADALNEQTKSLSNQFNEVKVGLEAIKTEAGGMIGEIASHFLPVINSVIDDFNSLSEETRKTILMFTGLALAIPGVIAAFGATTLGIGLLVAQFFITRFVLGLIIPLLAPLISLITSLSVALKNATVAVYGFASGTTAGSTALATLRATLVTSISTMGQYITIIGAAAIAVGVLSKALLDLDRAEEQQRKDENRNNEAKQEAIKKIAELRRKEAEGIKLSSKEQREYAIALMSMSLGDSNSRLKKESQRRAKLGRETQAEEKKEASKPKGLTDEQKKTKETFFAELSQEEVNLSKNSYKKAKFDADKWRKEELDKIKSNIAVNILTKQEGKEAELQVEKIYNTKLIQAKDIYDKEIKDKQDKANKEAQEKKEKAEREAKEKAKKISDNTEKGYTSILSGLDKELNQNNTKANNGEISYKKQVQEENKILLQQKNIYKDLMNDSRILDETKSKYVEKETEIELKVSQNSLNLKKKEINEKIQSQRDLTDTKIRSLEQEHEEEKTLNSKFFNDQMWVYKQHIKELEKIKKQTSPYGEERKNIDNDIRNSKSKIDDLKLKKISSEREEEKKYFNDLEEESNGREKIKKLSHERSIEYSEKELKINEQNLKLKKISEDEYFKNQQANLDLLADKYDLYSKSIVGDEVLKNKLIEKANDLRFQKESEALERNYKIEQNYVTAKTNLYDNLSQGLANIGDSLRNSNNSVASLFGSSLSTLGKASFEYSQLKNKISSTNEKFSKGVIDLDTKKMEDFGNVAGTVVNQITDSLNAYSEAQNKLSINTKIAQNAVLDFGKDSKEALQSLQDVNEQIADSFIFSINTFKTMPGIISEPLSKLTRMITDLTGITRSEAQKSIDAENKRINENSKNATLDMYNFLANNENATVEMKRLYANKVYEDKLSNLKRSEYTESAYNLKVLQYSLELFQNIQDINRKEIDLKLKKRKELNDLETDEIKKLKEKTQIEREEIENSLDSEELKYQKKLKLQEEFQKASQELYEKANKNREDLIDKATKKAIDGATKELNAQKIIFEKQSNNLKKTISELEKQIDAIKEKYEALKETSPTDSKNEFNNLVSSIKNNTGRFNNLIFQSQSKFESDQQLERKTLDIQELKGEISHLDKLKRFKEMAAEANVYYSNIAEQLPKDSEKFYEYQEKTLETFKDFSDLYNDYLSTKEKADTKPFEKKVKDTQKDLKEVESKINELSVQIEEYKNKFETIGTSWKDSMNNAMFGTDGWITKFNSFIDVDLANKINEATNKINSIKNSLPVNTSSAISNTNTSSSFNNVLSPYKKSNESVDDAIARMKVEDAAAEKLRLDSLNKKEINLPGPMPTAPTILNNNTSAWNRPYSNNDISISQDPFSKNSKINQEPKQEQKEKVWWNPFTWFAEGGIVGKNGKEIVGVGENGPEPILANGRLEKAFDYFNNMKYLQSPNHNISTGSTYQINIDNVNANDDISVKRMVNAVITAIDNKEKLKGKWNG